jgi:hypothetical protein
MKITGQTGPRGNRKLLLSRNNPSPIRFGADFFLAWSHEVHCHEAEGSRALAEKQSL